ncbi:phospholipase D-like domain-containing protein (plasmid) [Xylella fastidiosa subsp. pauca]|nr:phospholipase D-like domain-containing protein [Xylella fastidiosa]MDG5827003.1 phospholipase D-like domain-containing protein [Xylella fastidiosa subsp. pauca]
MHHKFMVADGLHVQLGSFNYTSSANLRNAETAVAFRNALSWPACIGRNGCACPLNPRHRLKRSWPLTVAWPSSRNLEFKEIATWQRRPPQKTLIPTCETVCAVNLM